MMQTPKRNGYVLMDVLVMILIAAVLFSAVTIGISTAVKVILDSKARILQAVAARNDFEYEARIQTTPE